ncbi:SprT family zinc-dependent metalloprotease [Endozoicomonas sp. 4G]|uniref:M48 family metallopeptidase n=1 Tax=Endozoicomonas sp. 4G TaxID=2872754 RepID=UPI0020791C69|nr:SprT family zinc-dependent metalloprotease [Endozoicomonas sp. 4G]
MSAELLVTYGDEQIRVQREVSSGHAGKVLITVHPDGRVVARAPISATDADVRAAVKKRLRWIYSQLRQFGEQAQYVMPRNYVSGETHLYLGRQHLLKVFVSPEEKPQVKMLRSRLEVTVREKSPDKVKTLLAGWYKVRAEEVFERRLHILLPQLLWISAPPKLRLQSMQTQWGSCSAKGTITLNPLLVKAPRECIDYVLIHECCHLAEHNHSERFYRLMGEVMPDWQAVKARLDQLAGVIFS